MMALINFWRSLGEMKRNFECLGLEASSLGGLMSKEGFPHIWGWGKRWVYELPRAPTLLQNHVTKLSECCAGYWVCMVSNVSLNLVVIMAFVQTEISFVYLLSIIFENSEYLSIKRQVEVTYWSPWVLQTHFCLPVTSWEQAETMKSFH